MTIENEDFVIEHLVTRRTKFGNVEFVFMDNMNVRKAVLRFISDDLKDTQIAKWEGKEGEGNWIASAVVHFAKALKNKRFNRIDRYCVFCCIGHALSMPHTGRYWHELKYPNELNSALAIVQDKTGRLFCIRGMTEMVTKAATQRKLAEARAAL